MNYELAKKLKDNGFPQEGINKDRGFGVKVDKNGDFSGVTEPIVFPTLSEIIEACADNLVSMHKAYTGGWFVLGKEIGKKYHGSTPSEAVANLWLVLHEKKFMPYKSKPGEFPITA